MTDFRDALYERYVSTFKGKQSMPDAAELASYFAWCEFKYRPLLRGLAPDAPILELGCGPGNMLEFLKRCGYREVGGIDVSAEQVDLARTRGLNADVADVFELLERRSSRYAALLAIDFVEHFSREELMRLLPLLHDALEDGGRLILQTPNGAGLMPRSIIYGDLTHMTILTPESLGQLLRLHGFDHIEVHETGPVPKNLVGRIRGWVWRLLRAGANAIHAVETGKRQAVWTENMICVARKSPDAASVSSGTRL